MRSLPTVNSSSGLIRNLRIFHSILRPLDFIEKRTKRYGDFYQIVFKNAPPTLMTSNPQAIEEIFTTSSDRLEVGKGNQILKFLVGDNSLLLLDGKVHKNRRRLLIPPFHGESLAQCSQQIVKITDKVIDSWQPNQSFKVREVMQEITMRVILTVVFGIDSGERYERLRELLTNF